MLATCHLRQFSGWMTLTKPHIFKVRDQTHPRQLLDPAVLESAAHCRSDRQELEFVNAMHARPKATFAAIGLTGFRSTPCSNIRSRCGGGWCHFDYIWFCLYIYLYSTFFKNSKPPQILSAGVEYFWVLPMIPLDMLGAECRGGGKSDHLWDFVHGWDEKIIAGRCALDAYPKGNMEKHTDVLRAWEQITWKFWYQTFFLNKTALVNHQQKKNNTSFEVPNLSKGARVVVYIYMCTHTPTWGPIIIGNSTHIFACWVLVHLLGMQPLFLLLSQFLNIWMNMQ